MVVLIDKFLTMLSVVDVERLFAVCMYAALLLLGLIQWFLSSRPGFLWGFLLPVLFLGCHRFVALWPRIIPEGYDLAEGTARLMQSTCVLGILCCLLIFAVVRITMYMKKIRKSREYRRRLEEKTLRQIAAANAHGAAKTPRDIAAGRSLWR